MDKTVQDTQILFCVSWNGKYKECCVIFFDESTNIFLEVPTFVSSLSMGSFNGSFHLS